MFSVCLSAFYLCVPVYRTVCVFSVCLSACLPSTCVPMYRTAWSLSVCLSACLPACLLLVYASVWDCLVSVCLSACLPATCVPVYRTLCSPSVCLPDCLLLVCQCMGLSATLAACLLTLGHPINVAVTLVGSLSALCLLRAR